MQEKLSLEQKSDIKAQYIKKIMASGSEEEIAVKLLTLEFAPFIKTLDREITTFNYRDSKFLKFDPNERRNKENPKAVAYAKEWGDASKTHNPTETGVLGWGLYTSNNPESSERYGEEDFSLVTMKYPKNAKMFDVRLATEYFIPMSESTLEYIKNICSIDYAYTPKNQIKGVPYSFILKSSLARNEKCQKIFVKALENLGVTGIIYEWSQSDAEMCDTSKRNGSAFVNFGSEMNAKTLDLYSSFPAEDKLKLEKLAQTTDPKERDKIRAELKMTQEDFTAYEKLATAMHEYGMYSSPHQPTLNSVTTPFLPSKEKQKVYADQWKKELFGCGKEFEEQDSPHYNPDQVWEVLLKDGLMSLDLGKDLNESLRSCTGE